MIVNLAELRQQRTLPPQPELDPAHPRRRNPLSLEQQKKRAKDLLRGLRSNDRNAIARLQHHLPESLSRKASPRLHDAQQVIARENGFRKWTDLKAHIDRIAVAFRSGFLRYPQFAPQVNDRKEPPAQTINRCAVHELDARRAWRFLRWSKGMRIEWALHRAW